MASQIRIAPLVDAATSTNITAQAMINGTAVYSTQINAARSDGYAFLDVTLADTPDVDISYQVSYGNPDLTGWKTPYDTDGNNVGTLATTLIASRLIVFEPVACEWIRFLIDPDANSTVSVVYGHKETL